MNDLFIKLFTQNYLENGTPDKDGIWYLKAETPREELERAYEVDMVRHKWVRYGHAPVKYEYDIDYLEECDKLRLMFEEDGIKINLLEALEIWSEYSDAVFASWLIWTDPPEKEMLKKIREELRSGVRKVEWEDVG